MQAHDATQESTVDSTAPALSTTDSYDNRASTVLRDATGKHIGHASFQSDGDTTLVTISAWLAPEQAGIHGIHVHANDVADNGAGCIADPDAPANTHFVSTDGHFNPGGATHGHHQGDLPALFFDHEGQAWLQFKTDQFHPDELRGHALILHASSDNYGNIPVGDAPDQYTPNSPDATSLTAKTGNAGARIGCGVIE
jgi:Cu-Zn family superoxide dismutase